ncbi:MAG TPA: hypothetical protein VKE94_09390 [Gemmataceae bacterium]|nr:hypothetical protein [Gemmataceae bacterium]
MTLLRENLKRTVADRWQQNCDALPVLEAFRAAGSRDNRSLELSARRPVMLDIRGFLHLLAEHQVEFVVVGGLAMIAQGSAYITKDLDICYARTPTNISALSQALATVHPRLRGAPPDLPFKFDAATIQAGLNFTLTTDLGDIDALGEISGIGTFPQVLALSEEKDVPDLQLRVRVLTIDGLIAAKKAAGRRKDRNHLLELEELKKIFEARQEDPGQNRGAP